MKSDVDDDEGLNVFEEDPGEWEFEDECRFLEWDLMLLE